jgi:hypothetical protein
MSNDNNRDDIDNASADSTAELSEERLNELRLIRRE